MGFIVAGGSTSSGSGGSSGGSGATTASFAGGSGQFTVTYDTTGETDPVIEVRVNWSEPEQTETVFSSDDESTPASPGNTSYTKTGLSPGDYFIEFQILNRKGWSTAASSTETVT